MNKIFYKMHLFFKSADGRKTHGTLESYNPLDGGKVLISTAAMNMWVDLYRVRFPNGTQEGEQLEWETYEDVECAVDPMTILDFKPRKRKEKMSEYKERRRKKFRWPYDMLFEDGTPNWKSKEFFGYSDKEKKLVQKLHEDWMSLEDMRAFMSNGKVNRLIGKMAVGEPAWIPPGIGRLVASGDRFHIVYSRHEAALEHQKFCEVRFPWVNMVVDGGKMEWRRSMSKTWNNVYGFNGKPLNPGARAYEIIEERKKQK